MTTAPPVRSFTHLKTVARLGSHHLFIARATIGEETSLAVLFDKHDTSGDWIVLSRYRDTPAGLKAADTVARAVLRAGIEIMTDDDGTLIIGP
jgi:hypothetical protein